MEIPKAMNPRTNAEMASLTIDRFMTEQRQVRGKPVRTRRRGLDFDAWILALDEPSRTRLERFLELAADAITLGKG
jgi:hypothetical protein